MNKILTICIAAYNVEKYINQTLESLLIAEKHKLEVLIVNDGSTDSTEKIVRSYIEKYPNLFTLINKENGGHGSTINTGIEKAAGKYFRVLDGDDWVDTDELNEFVVELEMRDEDMILSDRIKKWDDGSGRIEKSSLHTNLEPYKTYYFSEFPSPLKVMLSGTTVKTDLYRRSNLKVTEKCFYEDTEFLAYILYVASSFSYIQKTVYIYRFGIAEQSANILNRIKRIDELMKISLKLQDFYEDKVKQSDMPQVKKESILYKACEVSSVAFYTCMAMSPDRTGKMMGISEYMNSFRSKDTLFMLCKLNKIFNIIYKYPILRCCAVFVYRIKLRLNRRLN